MPKAAPEPSEKASESRQTETWKSLAFIALFVSALALVLSVVTTALFAS